MISISSSSLPADAPIGVFDSGVGGLSVLRHIRALLPQEHLLYFADNSFSPYGTKPEALVVERSLAIAHFLLEQGAKALVVACNTATVAAIKALRARYPQLPLVGVEPGLKPGAALSHNGKVGVLATDGTLAGAKFLLLRDQISAAANTEFLLQGCTGLADQIELGQLGERDGDATSTMLRRYIVPLLERGVDTLVLGCTHYPFVLDAIERIVAQAGLQQVTLVDTGEAVARQLGRLLDAAGLRRAPGDVAPCLHGYTTGGAPALEAAFSALLGLCPPLEEVRLDDKIRNI